MQSRIKYGSPGQTIFNECSQLVDDTVSWEQGDLLVFKNGLVQKASAESDNSAFLGIADNVVEEGKLVGPYSGLATTSRESSKGIAGPRYGVIAELTLKSGDGLGAGALVYGDPVTGPQVVSASGTKAIGTYQGTPITGNGSTRVLVNLGTRYPGDVLVSTF